MYPRSFPDDHGFRCLCTRIDASPWDGVLEVVGDAENWTGRVVREAVGARVRSQPHLDATESHVNDIPF